MTPNALGDGRAQAVEYDRGYSCPLICNSDSFQRLSDSDFLVALHLNIEALRALRGV